MHSFLLMAAMVAACYLKGVAGVASTDECRDADQAQSGYLPNHNISPALVESKNFTLLWNVSFNQQEEFFAKPLIYTPLAGGPQLLFLASTQNNIRTLDAKTGAVIRMRNIAAPFNMSDVVYGTRCGDMPYTVGITGTPVIDPATDIAYFYVKTYKPNFRVSGTTGIMNGVYYFCAIDVNTLQYIPGFPILVDGQIAQNDARRYFIGGTALQRPSLTQIGSIVYAGFGSHCDFFNYTGYLMGVDVKKAKVVTLFATQGINGSFSSNLYNNSGGSGIWMSGVGLASDGNRIFYVTGNGFRQTMNSTLLGNSGWSALADAVVNMEIDSNGRMTVHDFFMPANYLQLDAGDSDLGSGGLTLLDPGTFHGDGISKMAAVVGKSGVVYILNADNLGGLQVGKNHTDAVIQKIPLSGTVVYGAVSSYPLEGGYIYITPECAATQVYKIGLGSNNMPNFIYAGKTKEISRCGVGPGVPTITSFDGQAGTAILWSTDPDAGLRAWHAVPMSNGTMQTINLPQLPGMNKWARPAFGDGKVYVTDKNGTLYCLGASTSTGFE